MRRQYCKFCELEDFDDPALLAAISSVLPERDPREHIERKVWEFAMLALLLEDVGRLNVDTEVLATGAGNERVLYWLANRVGRIVATDIYGEGKFAACEAGLAMLHDPSTFAPYAYPRERLEVAWMDMCNLSFPDESFDVVFSLSSIEHVGGPREIAAASREFGRVLRPGGHAVLITDCYISKHWRNSAWFDLAVRVATLGTKRRHATPRRRVNADVMTLSECRRDIIETCGLTLLQPFDSTVSPGTFANLTHSGRDATLTPAGGEFYPHLVLETRRSPFTSACLVFAKAT